MNLYQSLVLGIVEGISEFLPISSTGHLILAGKAMGLDSTEFLKSFEIAIQTGAILAVVVLYWRLLLVNLQVMFRIAAAFVPTMVIGFALYPWIKKYLLGNEEVVLWSLFLGGIFLIVFEKFHRESTSSLTDLSQMSYRTAIIIGACQALAMVPGVSRAAATICCGLALGMNRKAIVEFSFLLAVPTMFAATALDLLKSYHTFTSSEVHFLGIGFIASFVMAILSIKLLLQFIKNHGFTAFGIYRIAAALVFGLIH